MIVRQIAWDVAYTLSGTTLQINREVDNNIVVGFGVWDFAQQRIVATEANLPEDVIAQVEESLSPYLRSKDIPRQAGILPGSCSVCGLLENPRTDDAVLDFLVDPRPSLEAPCTWPCHVCQRLVCSRCALTFESASGKQYYYHTYCSEMCREAAPASFDNDEDIMQT